MFVKHWKFKTRLKEARNANEEGASSLASSGYTFELMALAPKHQERILPLHLLSIPPVFRGEQASRLVEESGRQ